jgi:hypothetical protein
MHNKRKKIQHPVKRVKSICKRQLKKLLKKTILKVRES